MISRREMLLGTAAGAVGSGLLASPPGLLRVPILKADTPSRNGFLIPADVIRRALPNLESCPILDREEWRAPMTAVTIGRASAWDFRSGWLTAELDIPAEWAAKVAAGEVVARPGVHMSEDCSARPFRALSLNKIVEVYLETPDDQSWHDTVPVCPHCTYAGTVPVRWPDDGNGAEYRCPGCGRRHRGVDI